MYRNLILVLIVREMIMTFKNDSPLSIVLSFLKDLDSCFSTNFLDTGKTKFMFRFLLAEPAGPRPSARPAQCLTARSSTPTTCGWRMRAPTAHARPRPVARARSPASRRSASRSSARLGLNQGYCETCYLLMRFGY